MNRLVKPFLLMVFSFILVTNCNQPAIQNPNTLTGALEDPAECRTVQHLLGETCIPVDPQRVIALDEADVLDLVLALGVEPVGYANCSACVPSATLSKFVADVPNLGHSAAPSLEKILSLKPDLILGAYHKNIHSLLSMIAPTVLMEESYTAGFKKNLQYLAEILNRNDQAEEVLAEYNGQVQKFRQQFGEKLKSKTVSVIYLPDSNGFVAHKPGNSVYSQVMIDLGIQFSPAHESLEGDGYNFISIEAAPDWDADFLFVLENREEHIEDLKSLSFLGNPIWSTLSAVQNGKVHPIVLDVWGPLTAIQFVDDLYEYFINEL